MSATMRIAPARLRAVLAGVLLAFMFSSIACRTHQHGLAGNAAYDTHCSHCVSLGALGAPPTIIPITLAATSVCVPPRRAGYHACAHRLIITARSRAPPLQS